MIFIIFALVALRPVSRLDKRFQPVLAGAQAAMHGERGGNVGRAGDVSCQYDLGDKPALRDNIEPARVYVFLKRGGPSVAL